MAAQKQVLRTGEWVDSPPPLSLSLTRDASLSATPGSFLAWSIRLSRSGVDRLGVARKISAAVYEARAKSFFTANGRTLSTIASSCHGSTVPMPHPTPRPTLHRQCLVPRAAASYQLSATWYRCRCPLPVAGCRLPVAVFSHWPKLIRFPIDIYTRYSWKRRVFQLGVKHKEASLIP